MYEVKTNSDLSVQGDDQSSHMKAEMIITLQVKFRLEP